MKPVDYKDVSGAAQPELQERHLHRVAEQEVFLQDVVPLPQLRQESLWWHVMYI